MIDLSTPNEWQYIDPANGLVFPWYTKPFLDELVTWDLSDKVVFEYGCGASTLWWAKKCKKLYGAENNREYFLKVAEYVWPKVNISHEADMNSFVCSPLQWMPIFDIIIIDGSPDEWRDDCVKPAIECLKPGGKLIIDNWEQPSVWMPSTETKELLKNYPCKIYKQPNHPDWQTAVFTI